MEFVGSVQVLRKFLANVLPKSRKPNYRKIFLDSIHQFSAKNIQFTTSNELKSVFRVLQKILSGIDGFQHNVTEMLHDEDLMDRFRKHLLRHFKDMYQDKTISSSYSRKRRKLNKKETKKTGTDTGTETESDSESTTFGQERIRSVIPYSPLCLDSVYLPPDFYDFIEDLVL